MQIKIKALFMAVVMIAVAGTALISTDDSDATTGVGNTFQVSYVSGENNVTSTMLYAFDAAQAINTAASTLQYTVGIDMNWKTNETYANPSMTYGKVSYINTADAAYSIYVYIQPEDPQAIQSDEGWKNVTDYPLGWFRPFADYAETVSFDSAKLTSASSVSNVTTTKAGTANIAILVNGASVNNLTNITTIGLKAIDENIADFRYAITLKNNINSTVFNIPDGFEVTIKTATGIYKKVPLNAERINAGITVYGYGSDLYLALKNALKDGENTVVGREVTYMDYLNDEDDSAAGVHVEYYSWMQTIFDVGTHMNSGVYDNGVPWTEYIYWESTVNGVYMNFTLGYYSQLSGAYNSADVCEMTYKSGGQYPAPPAVATP